MPSDAEGLEFVVSEAIFGAAKAADEARGAQDACTEYPELLLRRTSEAGPTVRTTLAITNVTEYTPIAFKVKNTNLKRYLVHLADDDEL